VALPKRLLNNVATASISSSSRLKRAEPLLVWGALRDRRAKVALLDRPFGQRGLNVPLIRPPAGVRDLTREQSFTQVSHRTPHTNRPNSSPASGANRVPAVSRRIFQTGPP
jgi:hypothetical protein